MSRSRRNSQVIAVFLVTFLFQVVAAAAVPVQFQHQVASDLSAHASHDADSHDAANHDAIHADHASSSPCVEPDCMPKGNCVLHTVIALGEAQPGIAFDPRAFFEGEEILAAPSRRTAPPLRPPISA